MVSAIIDNLVCFVECMDLVMNHSCKFGQNPISSLGEDVL